MKTLAAICLALVLFFGGFANGLCDQKRDEAMLRLRAQALAERILRLEVENKMLVQEHNKAVREFEAIIRMLEQMKEGKKS
jgi:uncharacterized protein HemX